MARPVKWRHSPWLLVVALVAVAPATLGHAHDRAHDTGAGLIGNLLNALHMMKLKDSPEWMSNKEACAQAVDKTLKQLADEYLDTYVGFTLTTACEHMNVYKDFGGTEQACRPVFVDLGERFDGSKDYAGWCDATASFIDGGAPFQGGGVRGDAPAKAVTVASAGDGDAAVAVTADGNGEEVHEDLQRLRSRVEDLERDQAVQAGEDNSRAQPPQQPVAVDSSMPLGRTITDGHRAPMGQEHRARTLTDTSVTESNQMVDQIERAQAAEEKRAAYRALTHLRGTATSSFDSIANRHLQNIDEYNAKNTWRARHPVRHLAEEEGDIEAWAFPHEG